jgi:HD-GYP domain-containing protein (c-di-GMP phosphodiesterase class II)
MLGIDDAIVHKVDRLTEREVAQVRAHVLRSVEVLESFPGLAAILPIVRSHHERWDGTGYPDGLQGEKIPLLARIVAVADALNALTEGRPYRPAVTLAEAIREIEAHSAAQFDPECVDALRRLQPRLEGIFRQHSTKEFTISPEELKNIMRACRKELGRAPEGGCRNDPKANAGRKTD